MYSRFELLDDGDTNTDDLGSDLISLEALKLALSITDDDDDAALTAQIALWSEIIAEYCDRRFAFGRARETFVFELYEWARPNAPVVLQLYPIVVVDVVTVDGVNANYSFDAENGLLFPSPGSSWSGTVVVEYSGGYILPEGAPARLRAAIIEAVRVSRQLQAVSAGGGAEGVREITHGDTHVSFIQQTTAQTTQSTSGGVPVSVIDMIGPLKRVSV